MQEIVAELLRLRRLGRAMLLTQRVALIAAGVIGAVILVALLDYLLRFPATFRLVMLLGGLAALAGVVATSIIPAIRFRPDLTAMALRVERAVPALRGRLASSVEFAESGLSLSNPLAARAVDDAQRRAQAHPVGGVLDSRRTRRALAVLGGAAAVVALVAIVSPALARTGVERVLLPMSGAQWPARTGVKSLMEDGSVHPRGIPLPLRAQATLGDVERLRVSAAYRYETGGEAGPWRRLVLTHQNDGTFEQIIDADADAVEFSFSTDDAGTEPQRILLVEPPAVRRATLRVHAPTYAPALAVTDHELGTGTDQRASAAAPIAEGSPVELDLHLNKSLPVPGEPGQGRERWLRGTFGWTGDALPELDVHAGAPPRWTLRWRHDQEVNLDLNLVDEHGLNNIDDTIFRIPVAADREPVVTILEPAADDVVLPTAVVDVVVEGRDDVGLAEVVLRISREEDPARGGNELLDEQRLDASAPTARLTRELSMASLQATPGQTYLIEAGARDAFELDGRRHAEAKAPPRRLRVITETDLLEQIRRRLSVVRQNAIRIDAQQAELLESLDEHGAEPGSGRRQSQLGERLAEQRDALEAITAQQRRNGLDDEELTELIRSSAERIERAGEASNRAAEGLEQRAAEGEAEPGRGAADGADDEAGDRESRGSDGERDEAERQKDEPVLDAQREVREELTDLIALLDRDEDAWVVTRRLERLQEALEAAAQATEQTAGRTVGRDRDELAAEDLSELERIAAQQRDAADEAQALIDDMRERAEGLERLDPERAGVMRETARTAEQRQLERDLRRAAEETAQNRLANAGAATDSASETLERMMENIREGRRASARQLQRQLASLVESIERLVRTQEDEIIALAAADDQVAIDDRARAMIRLVQNTDGVVDEARRTGREADRVARVLGRAADAQGAAVSDLRADPVRVDRARDSEERSLALLNEALEVSRELQARAEEDEARHQREALLAQYRELTERQVALRQKAGELGGREMGRRELIESRGIGNGQETVRLTVDEMEAQNPAIGQSRMFTLTHRRIRAWSKAAEEALAEGDVGAATLALQDRIADSLSRITTALEQEQAEPEAFVQDQQQSPGGSSGAPGQAPVIPPAAELRLMRGLQEQIYEATVALDARGDGDGEARRAALDSLASEQRELFELALEVLAELSQGGAGGGNPSEPAEGGPVDERRGGGTDAPDETPGTPESTPQAGFDPVAGTGPSRATNEYAISGERSRR